MGVYGIERGETEPGPPVIGGVEVICGSMFCGKSEELIKRVRRALIARQETQVFKPALDDRRGASTVNSYDGNSIDAISVASSNEIFASLDPNTKVVAIDEAQFFDDGLADVCGTLADQGKRVIVAGLNTDFRGETFGVMGKIITEVADHVDTLHAICVVCGHNASRTQRIIKERDSDGNWNTRPANYTDSLIVVGGAESEVDEDPGVVEFYEARCRKHHVVPGRPHK